MAMDWETSESNLFQMFWKFIGKRGLDIAVGSVGLALSLPLWIITGIAIRLDSAGPVFYRQRRLGKNGNQFQLLKLRTMFHDAEKTTGPVWSREGDKRVTRVGKLLRRWHLDETPQFINVLLGDMSVIGPRPEREYIINKIKKDVPHYYERLNVKPGITGLAQVHQSYDSGIRDVRRKVRYDLLYIRKMCAYLDLKILYLTVLWIIYHKT